MNNFTAEDFDLARHDAKVAEYDDSHLFRDYDIFCCTHSGEGPSIREYFAVSRGLSCWLATEEQQSDGAWKWDTGTCAWCDFEAETAVLIGALDNLLPSEVEPLCRSLAVAHSVVVNRAAELADREAMEKAA